MHRARVAELPLYPEDRPCLHPTAEQIFRLFSLAARNVLETRGVTVRLLPPELTDLQRQVLQLMKIPASAFTAQS